MLSFALPSVGKASQLSSAPESHHPTGPSSPLAAEMTGSKLDKLKQLWERLPKFIVPVAGGNATGTTNGDSPTSIKFLSPKSRSKKQNRRRTIATGMIGIPQDFIHSKHIGIHDAREVAYQPHSIGTYGLFDAADLGPSLYRVNDSEGESQSEEEKTLLTVKRRRSLQERRLFGSSPLPALQPVPPPPRPTKVKRKSVPIHAINHVPESIQRQPEFTQSPQRFSCLSIEESLRELISCAQPEPMVDEQGRPLHVVGGEYMSQTVKARWDEKMEEIAQTLKTDTT
ncbi:hypothetical protein MJO28_011428 [Puccinia striiformis f. sp. tritici]|uniref:CRIB domain-containing protein n=2 Tax=Puccinia striiformis TaxID=27350 RepID=A0A2S4UX06_9BASI|nr:hypothetical protein MJO28_011428 [Puccinia striiformis f. sp. tritici]KAI7946668.1 hypothetical protein MJO29_011195 [Puccinia striiformis f. sp. tritici]POW01823.1 hypothetical protein PSTT_12226 [Puccinia striiformis]